MSPTPTDYKEFEQFRGRRFLFAAGHFDYFSGAEKQAVYFAGELVKHLRADVKFLGWGGNGRFAEEIRKIGAIPVVFPLHPGGTGWSHQLNLFRLARYIRLELRPDYLLPYVWMHCRVVGAIWKWTGAKFCWWNQRDEGRGITGSRFEQRVIESLPSIVSNSWEGRDFLLKTFNLPSARVRVVNNGVVLPVQGADTSLRRKLLIPDDAKLIAMVANLSSFKDHRTLLRAFAQAMVLCPHRKLHLALLGRLDDKTQELKALAWDLGLQGRLHFVGPVADVERALRSIDLVVHSSRTEGCPNGALEAMALGLPVLGTDISGMRQALGEENAASCLSPPGDWENLAQKIASRVECKSDSAAEGERNRQRISESFSIHQMVRESLRAISDVLYASN